MWVEKLEPPGSVVENASGRTATADKVRGFSEG